jgi:hypothetical protein
MKAREQESGVRSQPPGDRRQAAESGACSFCGLPAHGLADEPAYCCYGCRFAASIAAADGDEGQARWAMTRLGLAVFFSMNVMVFTLLLWSQDQASGGGAGGAPPPQKKSLEQGRDGCFGF